MQMPEKNQQGFTLVELLIVVAIIGILAAIAIPQFTQYRANAAESRGQADLTTCITEASAEYAANGKIDNNEPGDGDADDSQIEFTCTVGDDDYDFFLKIDDGTVVADGGSDVTIDEVDDVDAHQVTVNGYEFYCGVSGSNNRVLCGEDESS